MTDIFEIKFPSHKAGDILLPEEINNIIQYLLSLKAYTEIIKEDLKAQDEEQKTLTEQLRIKIEEVERKTLENSKLKGELESLKLQQTHRINQLQAALERIEKQQKKEIILDCGNGAYLPLMLIPAGEFTMGGAKENEKPQHLVKISSFYMGKYPVTQLQYKAVMGSHSSSFNNDTHPVDSVSWDEAVEFCKRLSTKAQMTVCLPSESQWEYACRALTQTKYYFGENASDLINYGWSEETSNNETHPVGLKHPNSWSLYDIHGGVWEWCEDHWHQNYQNAPNDGSPWIDNNENAKRVFRGGSWKTPAAFCTSTSRDFLPSDLKLNLVGFRVVVL